MRKPVIAGNWKMNTTFNEAQKLTQELIKNLATNQHVDVIICPPSPFLQPLQKQLAPSNISIGAQNINNNEKGAYTGEISAEMLTSINCEYVIIGHSERRNFYGEIDAIVHQKLKIALQNNLKAILCIGESLEERESTLTFSVIKSQIRSALTNISAEAFKTGTIIAYEPVWAIGTGKVATPEQAQEIHRLIREELTTIYSPQIANKTRIQYGGSVNPDNITSLISQPDIDGALVGGACLKASDFLSIIEQSQPTHSQK